MDFEKINYYQPQYYNNDRTNIEYGNIPKELFSFQVFSSREKCEKWLKEHDYDISNFAIIKYSNNDIEDYEIVE